MAFDSSSHRLNHFVYACALNGKETSESTSAEVNALMEESLALQLSGPSLSSSQALFFQRYLDLGFIVFFTAAQGDCAADVCARHKGLPSEPPSWKSIRTAASRSMRELRHEAWFRDAFVACQEFQARGAGGRKAPLPHPPLNFMDEPILLESDGNSDATDLVEAEIQEVDEELPDLMSEASDEASDPGEESGSDEDEELAVYCRRSLEKADEEENLRAMQGALSKTDVGVSILDIDNGLSTLDYIALEELADVRATHKKDRESAAASQKSLQRPRNCSSTLWRRLEVGEAFVHWSEGS